MQRRASDALQTKEIQLNPTTWCYRYRCLRHIDLIQGTVTILVHGLLEVSKEAVTKEVIGIQCAIQPGILILITKENTGAPPDHLPLKMQITEPQCLLATVILLPMPRIPKPHRRHIIKDQEPGVGINALA